MTTHDRQAILRTIRLWDGLSVEERVPMHTTDWPFEDDYYSVALTTKAIAQRKSPILYVSRDADDGTWQFHDGGEPQIEDSVVLGLGEIVDMDATLRELADLPSGWCAWRGSTGDGWRRAQDMWQQHRTQRVLVNEKEFTEVMRQPGPVRYEYFIKKVADSEEVWGLYDDGWATTEDDDGNRFLPFWPRREFAEFFCTDDWQSYSPKEIDLDPFMSKWLPGMLKDGVGPAIFWNGVDSVIVSVETLQRDLETELEKY